MTDERRQEPWQIEWSDSPAWDHLIYDADGRLVAHVNTASRGDGDSNARLLAAAPDLLAACEEAASVLENERIVLGHDDDGRCTCHCCTVTEPMVRAAITKARGEPS